MHLLSLDYALILNINIERMFYPKNDLIFLIYSLKNRSEIHSKRVDPNACHSNHTHITYFHGVFNYDKKPQKVPLVYFV